MATYVSRGRWKNAKHLRLLDKALLDVASGRCKRLIVTMPPRHGKSEMISKYFAAWYLGNFPDRRIILASYASSFASDWTAKVGNILTEYGYYLFGTRIVRNIVGLVETDFGGSMIATGAGSSITGRGANLFIIDDPVKNAEEAWKETYQEKTVNWFKSVAYTRLEPEGAIILVQTRWHDADLAGQLIEESGEDGAEPWTVLNLPAIAEEDDLLGREVGEALWPERFPIGKLETIRRAVGPHWWSAMYQQRPTTEGSNMVPRSTWRFYPVHDGVPLTAPIYRGVYTVQSWDTAQKEKTINDFNACATITMKENSFDILDVLEERMQMPALIEAAKSKAAQFNPERILIEDKSNGIDLIAMLKKNTRLPIRAIQPVGDKVLRLSLVTSLWDAGLVRLPEGHPMNERIIDMFAKFPYVANDDVIDAIVNGITHLFKKSSLFVGESAGVGATHKERPQVDDAKLVEMLLGKQLDNTNGSKPRARRSSIVKGF